MVISIANQTWQVYAVESNHPGLFVDGTARRGACWCGDSKIYVSNELEADQIRRVLMHELTHAYIYATQAVTPEAWDEESICELYAIWGMQICYQCQVLAKGLFDAKIEEWILEL